MYESLFKDENRGRVLLVASSALFILLLSWAYNRSTIEVGYFRCLEMVQQCDAEEVVLSLHRVHKVNSANSYVVEQGFREVPIEGPTEDLRVGETISVGGSFRAQDLVVVESWREMHEFRQRKIYLGYAGVVFILLMLPVWFRRSGGLIAERVWRSRG